MARDVGSKVENIDFRFALVDSDGIERYPYRIKKQDGRFGFVLGRDRGGQGEVVSTIEEVIRGAVFDGKRVRTTDFPPTEGRRSNGLSLASGREVQGYRIAASLAQLVAGASRPPMGEPVGPTEPLEPPSPVPTGVDWLAHLESVTQADFLGALSTVEPAMTGAQREMLRGHVNAAHQELSMQSIAELGGYADYATANAQYGRLGRLFAEALGIDPDQLTNKVQCICVAAGKTDAAGHFVWRLRPQLAEALREAGWVEPEDHSADGLSLAGALEEIAADTSCVGLPETTRKALVNARVGQGGYRLRMLRVWDSRCAVTGLGVLPALVASHALAWSKSDNRERLDEYNGLLLSATLDRLFDVGLIAFSDSGELLLGSSLTDEDLGWCGISLPARLRFVPARCKPYLREHRKRFGFER